VMFGTILSLFSWKKKWLFELLGKTLLTIFGMSAGIFVGCLAVALAEILDTFPIFFRRIHLKDEFGEVLLFVMALGKMLGSLFFFLTGYDTITP
ncbi:MAG: stage V sporulation protein AB, partial [Agathobacter sp.]|nr:stage V sporulation protein AB [Agathobacter sp.]